MPAQAGSFLTIFIIPNHYYEIMSDESSRLIFREFLFQENGPGTFIMFTRDTCNILIEGYSAGLGLVGDERFFRVFWPLSRKLKQIEI